MADPGKQPPHLLLLMYPDMHRLLGCSLRQPPRLPLQLPLLYHSTHRPALTCFPPLIWHCA